MALGIEMTRVLMRTISMAATLLRYTSTMPSQTAT
jgi:hypothetical protein